MKASTAAAILAFCANSAVSAPVQPGNNNAADAEKREAEPFLNNLIPDFSKANPNDDSPFNPFDDPSLPGKRGAEPFLNNLIPDFSKANPNDDSPFNPFDDPGLPGKAKREAEPFLSGLIPDFSKANPNDDSPFNPFDDPGLPGKAKREALINPATGMRAFNSFKSLVNLPEKIGDIFKREPEAFNPVAGMRAFNAAKNLVNLPEKIGDIFKRDPEMYKREPEAFLDALSDAVSGFGGIPGVQAGKIILDKVTKREAEPEPFNPVAGMRAFNAAKNLVNLPEKIGDIFKRDPEMYKREPEAFLDALSDAVSGFGGIPGVQAGKIILDKVTKREADPEAFNPTTAMRAFNGFKNVVNLPEKIGDIFKRDPEMYKREPEAFLDALSDAVSGFGGIPGVQAGKIILDKVTKRDGTLSARKAEALAILLEEE